MNDAHHADRMEHQRINRTNQLTFDLDKQTARELEGVGVVVRDKIQDSYHYTFIWNLNGEGWGTTDAGRRWFLVGPSEPLEPKVIP